MNAYLIDPKARSITVVDYDGDYKSIYKLIEANCFEVVRLNDHGDGIFIDEEGMMTNAPIHTFAVRGYPNPLAGRGLVLGCNDEGESVAPSALTDLYWLQSNIAFPTPQQAIVMQASAREHVARLAKEAAERGETVINCPGPTLYVGGDGQLFAD